MKTWKDNRLENVGKPTKPVKRARKETSLGSYEDGIRHLATIMASGQFAHTEVNSSYYYDGNVKSFVMVNGKSYDCPPSPGEFMRKAYELIDQIKSEMERDAISKRISQPVRQKDQASRRL